MAESVTYPLDRIGRAERIASLDVLRGIAILFILFMNIPWMGHYGPTLGDPRLVSWTPFDRQGFEFMIMLSGTQRGLLELLFGAGIMIMARRAMTPDGPVAVADLHYRRNLLLMVLGLFNAMVLFWGGDILLPYGLTALLLFQFRLWTARAQIVLAALLLLVPVGFGVQHYVERVHSKAAAAQVAAATAAHRPVSPELKAEAADWEKAVNGVVAPERNPEKQKQAAKIHAARTGPFAAYALASWSDWTFLYQPSVFFPILFEIAGTMVLGMALFQLGIIQGRARRRTYALLLVAGYGIGGALRVLGLEEIFAFSPEPKLRWFTDDVARIAVTLGHVGLIQLALGSGVGRLILAPFQAAGRMPLTTYLFTSFLTMWVLFPGFGLGLHGRWGFGGMMVAAAVIIFAEMVATNLWMARFDTGPMEWLWKSLAYGRRMPFRKRPAEAELTPEAVPAQ